MNQKTCNILSLDGGGIRGILELKQLELLESIVKKPLYTMFDIISGTSTGGLIAVMLSLGYSVKECLELYTMYGDDIFNKCFIRSGIFQSKYNDKNINKTLKKFVGEKTLADVKTMVIIPSYNATIRDKKIFKSYKEEDKHYTLFEVMRSTAAAPTYFDCIEIDGENYIDGGVVINNPALVSHVEALKMKYEKINILSLSTGATEKPITKKSLNGGKLSNISDLIDILLTEQAQTTDYVTNEIYNYHRDVLGKSIGIYIRCNSIIDKSSGKIDDVSKSNIENMIEDGKRSAEINKKLINAFYLNTLK